MKCNPGLIQEEIWEVSIWQLILTYVTVVDNTVSNYPYTRWTESLQFYIEELYS